jgi:hypothetical protein
LRTEHCTLRHPLPLSQQYPLSSAIPFDWVLRAFPLDACHMADLDENQSNLTIPSSPRSTVRTLRYQTDTSFSQLTLGQKGDLVMGTIPNALDPCGFLAWDWVAASCLRSGSPLPKMDQARPPRISLVVFAREACEWSPKTSRKTFPSSLGPPKRASIAQSTD